MLKQWIANLLDRLPALTPGHFATTPRLEQVLAKLEAPEEFLNRFKRGCVLNNAAGARSTRNGFLKGTT